MVWEIKISGFGGQGIVLFGYILGKAATLYDKKNAVLTQSYGPEARGGASSVDLVISRDEIDYPKITSPDILITMSREAYLTYAKNLNSHATLIYDPDLVSPDEDTLKQVKSFSIRATDFAETLGKKLVANMVMLGALVGVSQIVTKEAVIKSIESTLKPKLVELNIKAFEKGLTYKEEG